MAVHPGRSPRSGERSTLGRIGGLSEREADRGERLLWLSGGGYRAALFHLGALSRLNALGLLADVGTIGAVAGGSIVAALLATRVPWPLHGAYDDWAERVAKPMRAIARRDIGGRAARRPFPGPAAEAALEERYARELIESLGGELGGGPRFVFGAAGLTLSGLEAGRGECVEWEFESVPGPPCYERELVTKTIAALPTELDSFGEAEQGVLENHGFLLADAALRASGTGGGERAAEPPHPEWMDPEAVRAALAPKPGFLHSGRWRQRWPRRPNAAG